MARTEHEFPVALPLSLTPTPLPLTSLLRDRLGALLQISVADGCIEVQRRFLNSLELFEIRAGH